MDARYHQLYLPSPRPATPIPTLLDPGLPPQAPYLGSPKKKRPTGKWNENELDIILYCILHRISSHSIAVELNRFLSPYVRYEPILELHTSVEETMEKLSQLEPSLTVANKIVNRILRKARQYDNLVLLPRAAEHTASLSREARVQLAKERNDLQKFRDRHDNRNPVAHGRSKLEISAWKGLLQERAQPEKTFDTFGYDFNNDAEAEEVLTDRLMELWNLGEVQAWDT